MSRYQETHLSFVEEVTPGTTPGSPSMLKFRTTDPLALTTEKAALESEEVISHRQKENVRHGLKSVGGSLPFELSYGSFDPWLEALLSSTFSSGVLKVGSTLKTFTVEQKLASNRFIVGRGVTPNQLTLNMTPSGIITGSFDVIGMDFDSATTTLGAPTDVTTNAPFIGLGEAALEEGGSSIATVTSVDLTLNANKTGGAVMGQAGSEAATEGMFVVTGNLTARFNSMALFDKFKNETESSLKVTFTNPGDDQTLEFFIPRVKYLSGQPQNNDNVVDVALSFEGLYHTGQASSIVITFNDPA